MAVDDASMGLTMVSLISGFIDFFVHIEQLLVLDWDGSFEGFVSCLCNWCF